MSRISPHQARAKRVDRFMALAISTGGLTIIGAVLAMLLFIMKESVPLFLPAQSRALGTLQLAPASGAWSDESGKAIVLMSRTEGVKALRFPEGSTLPTPGDGPALPWRALTALNPRGEALVVGADDRLFFTRMAWSKPAGENDPAQWTLDPHWEAGPLLGSGPDQILHFRLMEAGGLGGGSTLRIVASSQEGLLWAETPLGASTAPLSWKPVLRDPSLHATAAAWSSDGRNLFIGTREGQLLDLDAESGAVQSSAAFGEPIQSLGFVLGQSSLLAGGAKGKLAAFQRVRVDGKFQLQAFHSWFPGQPAGQAVPDLDPDRPGRGSPDHGAPHVLRPP
jgi:hypothetical protein